MISTICHVEVEIPDVIMDNKYKFLNEYDQDISKAIRGFGAAGTDEYGQFEWAEFCDLADAQRCEKSLLAVVAKYEARLLEGL